MRNISRKVYSLLAIVGLWQCLASVTPVAAADTIPFFVNNKSGNTWHVACGGPWGRASDIAVPKAGQSGKFYEAESGAFSPFGEWTCHYATHNVGGVINRQNFCLARTATRVDVIIPAGASTTDKKPLEIQTTFCPPQGPVPPPALTQLSGSANNVGDDRPGRASVKLSGKFNVSERPALHLATVTLEGLLHEVEGAEELVDGLPMVLTAVAGSEADEATYLSAPNIRPKARLDVRLRNNQPAEFKLKLEKASLPQVPQQCSPKTDDDEHTTELAVRATIDDGVVLPLVVEGLVEVECAGEDPLLPTELKVQRLLPIAPVVPLEEAEE